MVAVSLSRQKVIVFPSFQLNLDELKRHATVIFQAAHRSLLELGAVPQIFCV